MVHLIDAAELPGLRREDGSSWVQTYLIQLVFELIGLLWRQGCYVSGAAVVRMLFAIVVKVLLNC